MRLTFWGTRGSIPAPLDAAGVRGKIAHALVKANGRSLPDRAAAEQFIDSELSFAESGTFGGNSACVELATGGPGYLICDLGSGARPFGLSVMQRQAGRPAEIDVLLSHVHWDHIMGFPFLIPAYIPGHRIRIHGCHAELEAAFRRQQSAPCFPVEFDQMGASIEFIRLEPDRPAQVAGFTVTPKAQLHGNDSYGYRIEGGGRTVVYSTDSEHKPDDLPAMEAVAAFFRDADAVLFDAQYSLAEAVSVKEDWGHSSNIVGVELCLQAKARRLVMIHHEPMSDDATLARILDETRRFAALAGGGQELAVISAHDGLVLEI